MWVRVSPNRLRYVDENEKPKPKKSGHYIIPDIQPYKAVAGDMAGKWITSRSQHREFLKRNGFQEVGNEHREFFEHGGKTRDNPYARKSDCGSDLAGRIERLARNRK